MRTHKGFTMLEMAAVIVGIAVITGLAFLPAPKFMDAGKKAAAQGDMVKIGGAISRYKAVTEAYPVNLQALTTSVNGYQPFLNSLPAADPWGTTNAGINGTGGASAYCYARTDKGFALWSLGQNKQNNSGGTGSSLPASFGGDDVGFLSE